MPREGEGLGVRAKAVGRFLWRRKLAFQRLAQNWWYSRASGNMWLGFGLDVARACAWMSVAIMLLNQASSSARVVRITTASGYAAISSVGKMAAG
jgi:hypothetical protein